MCVCVCTRVSVGSQDPSTPCCRPSLSLTITTVRLLANTEQVGARHRLALETIIPHSANVHKNCTTATLSEALGRAMLVEIHRAMGEGVSPTTTAIRMGLLAATVAVLWHKHAVDNAICSLWGVLRQSQTFSHDSFEPVLSTVSFAPPLFFFHALDKYSLTPSGAWLKMYR